MVSVRSDILDQNTLPGRAEILRFLLFLITFISGAFSVLAILHIIANPQLPVRGLTVLPIPVCLASVYGLRTRSVLASNALAIIVLTLFYLLSFVTLFRWGFDTPEGLLTVTFAGIMTALLYEGRAVWLTYLCAGLTFLTLASLQAEGKLPIRSSWKADPYSYADIIIYAATMAVIFAVTWLFNRQLHAAYLRSRASEQALREQSEHLEELVVQRTEALRQEHFQRLSDLHRFVLYGKEASGLLHDILNPLTALGLQLESLQTKKRSPQLAQAKVTLERLEQLVTGARRHMRRELAPELVSCRAETEAVFLSVQHRARENGIGLKFEGPDVQLFTDPILIYKIIQNLVANAIDACLLVPPDRRTVTVLTETVDDGVNLAIQDTGVGIAAKHLIKIFEPYYTTKKKSEGIGVGLSLIKELIEEELKGSITVSSHLKQGTEVMVHIPKHVIAKPYPARRTRPRAAQAAT